MRSDGCAHVNTIEHPVLAARTRDTLRVLTTAGGTGFDVRDNFHLHSERQFKLSNKSLAGSSGTKGSKDIDEFVTNLTTAHVFCRSCPLGAGTHSLSTEKPQVARDSRISCIDARLRLNTYFARQLAA